MLIFFVVCGIRSLKVLFFPVAAIYIIPYIWNRLMGKSLLALLVIGASGLFHMNNLLFSSDSINSIAKKGTIPVPLPLPDKTSTLILNKANKKTLQNV
jgi:hypothetical protein